MNSFDLNVEQTRWIDIDSNDLFNHVRQSTFVLVFYGLKFSQVVLVVRKLFKLFQLVQVVWPVGADFLVDQIG